MRQLRLRCPSCKQSLVIDDTGHEAMDVTCPACAARFRAKMPRPQAPAPPSPPATSDLPNAWAQIPPPSYAPPNASFAPPYSPPPRIKKKRKKGSPKVWLVPLAILAGCLLLVPMAWLGYRGVQALAGGKLAVPLLSDSHDKIFAEMNAGLEQSILPGTAGPAVMVDAAAIRKSMEENSARMEKWMLRAIALGPASREQFAAYKAKRDLAMEKFKADFARRIEEMKNAPPPKMPDPSAGGFELTGESAWHNQINRVAGLYFQKAVADTPPSTNENETRMHKESLLLREMLRYWPRYNRKKMGKKRSIGSRRSRMNYWRSPSIAVPKGSYLPEVPLAKSFKRFCLVSSKRRRSFGRRCSDRIGKAKA